jgi:hypothetical protein
MYSPYYRQARPPDQPGQQRSFNKIQFSGHTRTLPTGSAFTGANRPENAKHQHLRATPLQP